MARKCKECEYGQMITVTRTGVGASSNLGTFSRDEIKCLHPDNKKWYQTFCGTTRPKSCPLK